MYLSKNELYTKAKNIKKLYNDCNTAISTYNKSELLYYINNCKGKFINNMTLKNNKKELYKISKDIKKQYVNCDSPISKYNKTKLNDYINVCDIVYDDISEDEYIIGCNNKICDNKNINNENQILFDNMVFNSKFNTNNVLISLNYIRFSIPNDNDLYKSFNKKNLVFHKIKKIGGGTYGVIFLFYNFEFNIQLALKKEFLMGDKIPIEEEISNLLNDNDNKCDTVKVKYINQDDRFSYYILNKLEGDVESLINKLNNSNLGNNEIIRIKLKIAEIIRRQVLCLYDINNKFVYTDLKLLNVLYGCNGNKLNKFSIHLGDLGSVVSNNNTYISTYLSYQLKNSKGVFRLKNKNQKEKFLSWLIGVVLLNLIGSKKSKIMLNSISWKYIGKITRKDFIKLCNDMKIEIRNYYNIPHLSNYLSFNPSELPNIRDSLL